MSNNNVQFFLGNFMSNNNVQFYMEKKFQDNSQNIGPRRSTVSLDQFPCIVIFFSQVEVVAAFVQVEEVERISMEPWERVERVVRDFFREGWVGEPVTTMSLVGLGEEVGLGDGRGGRRRRRVLWGR